MTIAINRRAETRDMPVVFEMGYDEWGGGSSLQEHIENCINSPKYKKGVWHVLEVEGYGIVSSLIIYTFGNKSFGIGSVATKSDKRRNGYASNLIQHVIDDLISDEGAEVFFLYSDIDPIMYKKLGFEVMPEDYQNYPKTKLMCSKDKLQEICSNPAFEPPKYF